MDVDVDVVWIVVCQIAITIDALSKKLEENFAGRGGYETNTNELTNHDMI